MNIIWLTVEFEPRSYRRLLANGHRCSPFGMFHNSGHLVSLILWDDQRWSHPEGQRVLKIELKRTISRCRWSNCDRCIYRKRLSRLLDCMGKEMKTRKMFWMKRKSVHNIEKKSCWGHWSIEKWKQAGLYMYSEKCTSMFELVLSVLSEHNYFHTILGFKILIFSRFHAYHQIRSNYIPPRAFASESKIQGFGIFPTYLDSKQSFGLY